MRRRPDRRTDEPAWHEAGARPPRGRRGYNEAVPEGYGRDFEPPRRRREHFEGGEADRRRRGRGAREPDGRNWRGRGREFISRFKEPIIGLTVAGAALPLAQQARGPERPARQTRPVTQARATVAPRGPAEEDVAERWAVAEEEAVREQTIEGATVRYGIEPRLAASIYDAAVAEGVEPDMGFGLVNAESTFRPRAVSHVGARGLTQLLPSTARWMVPGTSADDLFHPDTNLRVGFKYLRYLLDKYGGNADLALTAYNRGPGTVDGVLSRGGNPDNGYAGKVLRG